MYEKINITENYLNVLSLFTQGFGSEHYIRGVEKKLGISPRTSQLILDDLEKKGVLGSRMMGKTRLYSLKRNRLTKKYLLLAEVHKEIGFFARNPEIKEVIDKISSYIGGIGIIFGSYAKSTNKKDSDLDLFVIGKYDRNKIKEASRIYKIEINVKNYPLNAFRKSIKEDILVKEVLSNHIIFLNSENFIELVMENM